MDAFQLIIDNIQFHPNTDNMTVLVNSPVLKKQDYVNLRQQDFSPKGQAALALINEEVLAMVTDAVKVSDPEIPYSVELRAVPPVEATKEEVLTDKLLAVKEDVNAE